MENKIKRSDILTDEIKQSIIDMLYEETPKELHYKIDDFKQTL